MNKLYVLDLFSGSGILGFEFFSMNVKKVIMLEIIFFIYKSIIRNKFFLIGNVSNFDIFYVDSFLWIKKFNILNISLILFDPPYIFTLWKSYFTCLNKIFFLKYYLLIFIESDKNFFLKKISYDWFLLKKGFLGKTFFYLFKRI